MTTALRLILAIPHLLLVGGIGFGAAWQRSDVSLGSETGLLGAVAFLLAIVSWFTIVFGGQHFPGIRQFTTFYMRWRVRALAYVMLLRDEYPPFGDEIYPATIEIEDPAGPRDRLSVGLRILLGIPHFILLAVLVFAWWIASFLAWLLILVTGEHPTALHQFGTGVLRWLLRVETYILLLVDEYPPFSLS